MTSNIKLPPMFQKIAKDNFPEPTETTMVNADQLAQANAAIASLAKEYPTWAARDVGKMRSLFNDAKSVSGDERNSLIRTELFKIAHNAKGQGATFGYPLITEIGNHLCRFIENALNFDSKSMNVIKEHITALDTILKKQLTGDGGTEGQHLRDKILNI